MKSRFTLVFFLCILCAPGLSAQQGEALGRSLIHDDTTRTYIVYMPQAYTGDEAWPLIISLHGYTGTASLQRLISNFEALADTEHFLLAYPQGLEIDDPSGGILPALPPRGAGWNLQNPDGPDDLGFMVALIDSMATEFNIDAEQVFVAGHSNGGALAYVMACELTSRVAAIASVGGPGTSPGLVPFLDCNATGPMPVLDIHGTADAVVPYTGVSGLFASIPATMEGWGNFNGCGTEAVVTEIANTNQQDGSSVTLIQYLGCEQDAEVWHFRVNGGGHWWPGSIDVPFFLESVFGKTNRDFDASREIWNFFTGQPLTGIAHLAAEAASSVTAFPNPFEDVVSFSFHLPEAGKVRLNIFGPLGNLVATLPGGEWPEGWQQLQWQIQPPLAPGIYQAVIESNNVPVGRTALVRK